MVSEKETEVMRETKSRENDGWARAPVPVTHILTLSGRSLQSQPFHRESFYVTGTLLTHLIHPSPTAEGLRLGENGE